MKKSKNYFESGELFQEIYHVDYSNNKIIKAKNIIGMMFSSLVVVGAVFFSAYSFDFPIKNLASAFILLILNCMICILLAFTMRSEIIQFFAKNSFNYNFNRIFWCKNIKIQIIKEVEKSLSTKYEFNKKSFNYDKVKNMMIRYVLYAVIPLIIIIIFSLLGLFYFSIDVLSEKFKYISQNFPMVYIKDEQNSLVKIFFVFTFLNAMIMHVLITAFSLVMESRNLMKV